MSVWVACMPAHYMHVQCPRRSEKGNRSLELGLWMIVSYMGPGNCTSALTRQSSLQPWSSLLTYTFLPVVVPLFSHWVVRAVNSSWRHARLPFRPISKASTDWINEPRTIPSMRQQTGNPDHQCLRSSVSHAHPQRQPYLEQQPWTPFQVAID